VVHDRVRGAGAELSFALAPAAKTEIAGARATLSIGGSRAIFVAEGIDGWRLEPSEHAARFARREPATRLVASIAGAQCSTEIRVEPSRSAVALPRWARVPCAVSVPPPRP